MTAARVARPAATAVVLCRDGLLCNQPAAFRITAAGLAEPQYRCLDDLAVAVDCICESLTEAGIEPAVTVRALEG